MCTVPVYWGAGSGAGLDRWGYTNVRFDSRSSVRRRSKPFVAALVASGLLLASCGSDDDKDSSPSTAASTAAPNSTTASSTATSTGGSTTDSSTADSTADTTATTAAPAAAVKRKMGGEMTIGVLYDAFGLDPIKMIGSVTDGWLVDAAYDTLIRREADGTVVPWLAESFETKDSQTWTFKLRSGVKFQDGEPLTAEAVKINIERHMDPKNASRSIGSASNIESVTAVDDLTVDLKLKFPWAAFPQAGISVMTAIASPKAIADGTLATKPVGTGPYMMTEWVPGDHMTMVKNPDYWGDGPYLDKVTFRVMLDSGVRYTSVQKGEIQVGQSIAANQLADANKGDGSIHSTETHGGSMAIFPVNNTVPGLDDVRVRQAMSYALDRSVINDVGYKGAATANASLWAKGAPFYDDTIKWADNDMDKAKSLIAEYEAEKGPVKFELMCYSDPERQKIAEVAMSMWEEAGIEVTSKQVQNNQMIVDTYTGNYQVSCAAMGNELSDPDAWFNWFRTGSGTNWAKYSNPELDDLLMKGRTSAVDSERQDAYSKAAAILARDVPVVRTLGTPWGWVAQKGVIATTLPLADFDVANLAYTE